MSSKRDSSYLEWHYKRPTDEELQDQYECFDEDQWAFHYQASKESTGLTARKKADPAIMRDEAKRLACEDCTLPYQLWALKQGVCEPIDWDLTPKGRGDE